MSTFKNLQPVYQMTPAEQQEVQRFLSFTEKRLSQDAWERFKPFFDHLCMIQDPSNREFPFVDSLSHGMEVAWYCMLCKPDFSEALLLAAIGHDWDRACGKKRISSSDYPNTPEGNSCYKEAHAENSALLFCAEMEKFYSGEIIETVRYYIRKHEVGGPGELAVLDFSDARCFFSPRVTDYFRNHRIYKDEQKNPLLPVEMEKARKEGFVTKVKFMTENMDEEGYFSIQQYARGSLHLYEFNVANELVEIFAL